MGRIVAEHNQAELSKLEVQTANSIYHWSIWRGYRDDPTEARAVNPAATRLDEPSGKALDADHDNQAELNKLGTGSEQSLDTNALCEVTGTLGSRYE